MWEGTNLYREPIAYTQNVDPMSWSQPCPKVQFDETAISNYLFSSQSTSSPGQLNVPSLDEVMERQGFALAVEVFSVCE